MFSWILILKFPALLPIIRTRSASRQVFSVTGYPAPGAAACAACNACALGHLQLGPSPSKSGSLLHLYYLYIIYYSIFMYIYIISVCVCVIALFYHSFSEVQRFAGMGIVQKYIISQVNTTQHITLHHITVYVYMYVCICIYVIYIYIYIYVSVLHYITSNHITSHYMHIIQIISKK